MCFTIHRLRFGPLPTFQSFDSGKGSIVHITVVIFFDENTLCDDEGYALFASPCGGILIIPTVLGDRGTPIIRKQNIWFRPRNYEPGDLKLTHFPSEKKMRLI